VFIPGEMKLFCFEAFLQVLILRELGLVPIQGTNKRRGAFLD